MAASIKKALEAEQEYLRLRSEGQEPVSLLERIQACGFRSLESYFQARRTYYVKCMDFSRKEVTPETAAAEMIEMVKAGQPGLLLMNTDRTVVYHGDGLFNRAYCEEHGIPVIEYLTSGGTLVASPGELSMGVCIPGSTDADEEWFLGELASIIAKYENDVKVDGNDILIAGKKVSGAAMYRSETAFCAVAQFSFDDKAGLIANICPVPRSGKIPGFITGMTRQQLREEIIAWL